MTPFSLCMPWLLWPRLFLTPKCTTGEEGGKPVPSLYVPLSVINSWNEKVNLDAYLEKIWLLTWHHTTKTRRYTHASKGIFGYEGITLDLSSNSTHGLVALNTLLHPSEPQSSFMSGHNAKAFTSHGPSPRLSARCTAGIYPISAGSRLLVSSVSHSTTNKIFLKEQTPKP